MPLLAAGWGPYAYFRAVEALRANSTSECAVNALSVQATEAQAMNRQVIGSYGETVPGHEVGRPFDLESAGR